MRRLKLIAVVCLHLAILSCTRGDLSDQKIRVMTFNIRLNTASDSLNAWPYRKDMAASMIRFHRADIAGLQEALHDQVLDLAARLPDYGWFGLGRDDGKEAGEYMAVFYSKKRFEVLRNATFWLSENPEIPGRGWDAACNRVVTWGEFRDRKTGKRFFHFNTHFDHMGETARRESAKLLLEKVEGIAGHSDAVVTGDFNSTPDSVPYEILTRDPGGTTGLRLKDAKTVSVNSHHGPSGTFTAFNLPDSRVKGRPIDFIFVSEGIHVFNHGTLSD
ncbi:endonuclease/exonuclease/phosphatase family protein, partial [bacterium]|nr:endonuclease/exonuclease/phosphatase family protein [bacterium]